MSNQIPHPINPTNAYDILEKAFPGVRAAFEGKRFIGYAIAPLFNLESAVTLESFEITWAVCDGRDPSDELASGNSFHVALSDYLIGNPYVTDDGMREFDTVYAAHGYDETCPAHQLKQNLVIARYGNIYAGARILYGHYTGDWYQATRRFVVGDSTNGIAFTMPTWSGEWERHRISTHLVRDEETTENAA